VTKAGIPCTIRIRRGIDIQAGCGQLASPADNVKRKTGDKRAKSIYSRNLTAE
jgi:hypothetical protein